MRPRPGGVPGVPRRAGGRALERPDPAADPEGRPAFDRVADELAERIGFLLFALEAS
ncbi:hypothetical protein [Dactylosporangium darangshiense]|uniref:hypothetical protein n=1 Tax=Dactylosporangium darangshiense TaxID=579108 RepID=UPI003626AA6A